jgi:hypothetical protein
MQQINHSTSLNTPLNHWLSLGAIFGPVILMIATILLAPLNHGYTLYGAKIGEYLWVSQPISGLGLGATAIYMNSAFVISGLLIIAGAVGIFRLIPELSIRDRRLCTFFLALTGLGMIIDGIFTLESFKMHFLGFLLGIGTLLIGFVVVGRKLQRIQRWKKIGQWLIWASPLTLALTILHFVTFDYTDVSTGIAGLTERILLVEVFAWFVILGWKTFRDSKNKT